MSNCLGTSSAARSGILNDTPVILDVRWRQGPDIAPWTHSWSSCIYSFKEISTDYLPYTGVHHSLRLCSLFYRLLCRVAIVLTSKVAACSTSSSLDQRPRVKRSAPSAVSRDNPIANNTGEGSVLPSCQAEAVELATSGVAASSSSPLTH